MKAVVAIPETVRLFLMICPTVIFGVWSAYWTGRFLFWWNDLVVRVPQAGDDPMPALGGAIIVTSIFVGMLVGTIVGGVLHRVLFAERYVK